VTASRTQATYPDSSIVVRTRPADADQLRRDALAYVCLADANTHAVDALARGSVSLVDAGPVHGFLPLHQRRCGVPRLAGDEDAVADGPNGNGLAGTRFPTLAGITCASADALHKMWILGAGRPFSSPRRTFACSCRRSPGYRAPKGVGRRPTVSGTLIVRSGTAQAAL